MHSRNDRSFDEHYDNLSEAQIKIVYTYQKFGYTIWFVRTLSNGHKLAVLKCNDQLVSIDHYGKSKEGIDIKLRDSDTVIEKT